MNEPRDFADRLDSTGAALADLARRLPYLGPPATAFGVDAPGLPGETGRVLHGQWLAALEERAREAGATADKLIEIAAALRAAAAGYADSDDAARRRAGGV